MPKAKNRFSSGRRAINWGCSRKNADACRAAQAGVSRYSNIQIFGSSLFSVGSRVNRYIFGVLLTSLIFASGKVSNP